MRKRRKRVVFRVFRKYLARKEKGAYYVYNLEVYKKKKDRGIALWDIISLKLKGKTIQLGHHKKVKGSNIRIKKTDDWIYVKPKDENKPAYFSTDLGYLYIWDPKEKRWYRSTSKAFPI